VVGLLYRSAYFSHPHIISVGADGARSAVREMIGAKLEGQHGLAHHYNTIIRIPEFAHNPPRQQGIMYWPVNPESPAVMTPMDSNHTWTFGTTLKESETELSEEELRRRIFKSVGREVAYEIVAVDRWSGHRLIADRYRDRRIVLAGDACHLHPPFGGFGMNMGIGDAVDLGWKLAAVLRHWSGPLLLDSYEQERRTVHLRVLQVSVQNYSVLSQHLVRDSLESADAGGTAARKSLATEIVNSKAQEFKSLGVVLGSHYSGTPIVVGDGTEPPSADVMNYTPSAHPGCLAPHLWLDDSTSLYDRFDTGFTVLVTDASAEASGRRLLETIKTANMRVALLMLDNARLRELYGRSLVLIRPDQHVAWRGDTLPADLSGIIDRVGGFGGLRSRAETAA
jgi:hypothetical protein